MGSRSFPAYPSCATKLRAARRHFPYLDFRVTHAILSSHPERIISASADGDAKHSIGQELYARCQTSYGELARNAITPCRNRGTAARVLLRFRTRTLAKILCARRQRALAAA
jgi:hypothetical protein